MRSRRSCWSGSKSLDQDSGRYSYRSHSLDLETSDAELVDGEDCPENPFPKYRVLADYMAMTSRELNLLQGEVVELIKIGCAGWWFIRHSNEKESSGWAPSTYLEKIHVRQCRTLDRLEWRNPDRCESVNSGTLDRRKSRTLDWGGSRISQTPEIIEYKTSNSQELTVSGNQSPAGFTRGTLDKKGRIRTLANIEYNNSKYGSENW